MHWASRLILCFVLPVGWLVADDWVMYLRDPAHSSFNAAESQIGKTNAKLLAPVWMFSTGAPLAAAATVSENVLYFGDWDGNFYALDGRDGHQIWKTYVGKAAPPEDPECFPGVGVTAQATVVGDVVYVGGGDSAVYALRKITGELLWRVSLADPAQGAYLWSSLTVSGNSLYIGVASLADCPLVRGALARFDLAAPLAPAIRYLAPEGEVGAGIWSTPAIDETTGTVFVTTGTGDQDAARGLWGGTFLSLDSRTLKVKAHYFLPTNSTAEDIEWGSSPTLFQTADGIPLVCASGKDGVLYALRRDDLSLVWQTRVAVGCLCPECGCGSLSTPAFDGARLYLGAGVPDPEGFDSGSVYAVEPGSGRILWNRGLGGTVIAPVTVANGLVYASTLEGVEIFDAQTGASVFQDDRKQPLYSQPVVVDGTLFSTYLSGDVVARRPPATCPPTPSAGTNDRPSTPGKPPTPTPNCAASGSGGAGDATSGP